MCYIELAFFFFFICGEMSRTFMIHYNRHNNSNYYIGGVYSGGVFHVGDTIYLLVTDESYKDPRDRSRVLNTQGKIYNYIYEYSTKRIALYKEQGKPNFIMGHRGTVPSDIKDLESDLYILANQFEKSQRFKKAYEQTQKVYDVYSDGIIPITITHTGHSLGAKVASRVAIRYNSPAITFNMGTSPLEITKNMADRLKIKGDGDKGDKYLNALNMQRHYTTGVDPISLAANVMIGHEYVAPITANVHSLANFY
jgi:hypothetical protein